MVVSALIQRVQEGLGIVAHPIAFCTVVLHVTATGSDYILCMGIQCRAKQRDEDKRHRPNGNHSWKSGSHSASSDESLRIAFSIQPTRDVPPLFLVRFSTSQQSRVESLGKRFAP